MDAKTVLIRLVFLPFVIHLMGGLSFIMSIIFSIVKFVTKRCVF